MHDAGKLYVSFLRYRRAVYPVDIWSDRGKPLAVPAARGEDAGDGPTWSRAVAYSLSLAVSSSASWSKRSFTSLWTTVETAADTTVWAIRRIQLRAEARSCESCASELSTVSICLLPGL